MKIVCGSVSLNRRLLTYCPFLPWLCVVGWIPLMMPFGLADAMTSTLDVYTVWDTVYISARETIRNLLAGKI